MASAARIRSWQCHHFWRERDLKPFPNDMLESRPPGRQGTMSDSTPRTLLIEDNAMERRAWPVAAESATMKGETP